MSSHVIALDQGTTSSRTIVFTQDGRPAAVAQRAIPQLYPSPGHVEHDPEVIWRTQRATMTTAFRESRARAEDIAAIGIGNQRETVLLWEKRSGHPVHNAIVWQSRITADLCDRLRADGCEDTIRERTGLCLDPYFSGTKIRYLLDRDPDLRRRADRGEVLAGTIDTWLIWRLTRGRVHATDVSNASRTLLFNIHTLDWDDTLLDILGVPRAMLPEVRDSSGFFGETDPKIFGRPVPITGVAGDQQAATFGQGCLRPGMAKSTYGTGCFILMNTGAKPVPSANGLLTTVGWRIKGKTTYCLEGAVFIGGAAVQWLRDGLGIIRWSADVERVAASVPDSGGVCLVPAFVGLGAPHWDPYARGILVGIERGTTAGHVARAALESMAFQCADVIDAMAADAGTRLKELRVDGGAAVNDGLMQFQADVLGVKALRPAVTETTALGAACLAGLAVGFWKNQAEIKASWALDRAFRPAMKPGERAARRARWNDAVARSRGWARP